MNLTDYIMSIIVDSLKENSGSTSISRNELASEIGCVPSQISYVLSSRFTQERGYIVESKRGGGGYIRITKIETLPEDVIMHVVNSIGETIDEDSCNAILCNLKSDNLVTEVEYRIMKNAISVNVLSKVTPENRKNVRATIFKNMLMALLIY